MYAFIKTKGNFTGRRYVHFAANEEDAPVPHIGIDTVQAVITEEDIDFGLDCFSSRLLKKVRATLKCPDYKYGISGGVIYFVRQPPD